MFYSYIPQYAGATKRCLGWSKKRSSSFEKDKKNFISKGGKTNTVPKKL